MFMFKQCCPDVYKHRLKPVLLKLMPPWSLLFCPNPSVATAEAALSWGARLPLKAARLVNGACDVNQVRLAGDAAQHNCDIPTFQPSGNKKKVL